MSLDAFIEKLVHGVIGLIGGACILATVLASLYGAVALIHWLWRIT